MKASEFVPWILSGGGLSIGGWGLWFTNAKLGDERRKDAKRQIEEARLAAIDAANQSLGGWKEMVTILRGERDELSKRVDMLQSGMDQMRSEMREGFRKRDDIIDLLRGQNRELKQLAGSHARNAALRPDPEEEPGL